MIAKMPENRPPCVAVRVCTQKLTKPNPTYQNAKAFILQGFREKVMDWSAFPDAVFIGGKK